MNRLLWPLAILYRGLVWCRTSLYQKGWLSRYRLPGQVISVGNLEVGGTGKSPVVIAIAQQLLAQGARPAVLTRGYRSGLGSHESVVLQGDSILLAAERSQDFQADEARLQAHKLQTVPIVVGRRRYAAALRYLQHFPPPTHWILDDGFQHLGIQRDCDIVLLDAHRPFDNGWCLPAGRLREPPAALTRAHLVIFTRAGADYPAREAIKCLESWNLPHLKLAFRDGEPLQVAGPTCLWTQVQSWSLAIGIARPDRILRSLASWGVSPIRQYLVRDHGTFDPDRLADLKRHADAILTTEKDYWRSPQSFVELRCPVFVLPLHLDWSSTNSLLTFLQEFNLLPPNR